MAEALPVVSFRRITPSIAASARLALVDDVPDTSKSEASLVLKKAAPALGIDGTTYHIMDILLGLSRAADWQGADRPIVAISNAKLAEYTMRSQRTVIRCIRRLVEAGIAAYRDSSTGRRYVYRSRSGSIETGFGIDLTPTRVRLAELKRIGEQYQERIRMEAAARRDVVRLSRAISDLCAAFPDRATAWLEHLGAALNGTQGATARAHEVRRLHAAILTDIEDAASSQRLSSTGDIHVMPYTNTTRKTSIESKERPRSNERENTQQTDGKAVGTASEEKPGGDAEATQPPPHPADMAGQRGVPAQILEHVSIGLVETACRETRELTGLRLETWNDLAQAGETLRRMIGLSESGWQDGVVRVGRHAAAAIVATVLEKSLRDPSQISKPGGYFRAMVDRASAGQLHLERSLFGLADVGPPARHAL